MEHMTLGPCHCGSKKMTLAQISNQHFEIKCLKCVDYAWGVSPKTAVNKWNDMQKKEENPNISIVQTGKIKECCKLSNNLFEDKNDKRDVRILRCRVCGCKHINFKIDMGEIGLRLKG